MPDRSLIGKEGQATTITVDAKAIADFAKAVGEENPVYFDAAAARAAGYPDVVAPPTYPIAFMSDSMDADLFFALDLNIPSIVHGEQEFEYFRPVVAGDRLTLKGRIANMWEKIGRSGALDFVLMEATATDERGEPVYVSRTTLISKRQPKAEDE